MISMRLAVLSATLTFSAFANDLSGTWKAWFVGPIGQRPKMVSEMTFEFKVDGDKLTGMAHMASWPGDASITEGKVDGDRISFTVVGKSPWRAGGLQGESSGFPKLDFVWKLNGTDAKITLIWESVMIYGAKTDAGATFTMQGKRVPNSN